MSALTASFWLFSINPIPLHERVAPQNDELVQKIRTQYLLLRKTKECDRRAARTAHGKQTVLSCLLTAYTVTSVNECFARQRWMTAYVEFNLSGLKPVKLLFNHRLLGCVTLIKLLTFLSLHFVQDCRLPVMFQHHYRRLLNPFTPTVAIWVQLQSILCQTGLSRHL